MKRILLLIFMVVVLAGCGNTSEIDEEPDLRIENTQEGFNGTTIPEKHPEIISGDDAIK